MQSYLVTGGAGFIGSHLVDSLLSAGHRVVVLDDLSTGKVRNVAHHSSTRFDFVEGSILDDELLMGLMDQVEAVYHLAAVVGVRYIVDNPLRGMLVNVRGTENVLRAAEQCGAKVVVASSSEVYGKSTQVPFREDDGAVLGSTSVPRWSYALSKLLDEHLAFAYARQRGVPVAAVRYFNAYGPRLDPRGYGSVVARFIMQALAGSPITVYGDGKQTRSFTFVEDTVRGTVAAMDAANGLGMAFNIGNSAEITIDALARRICEFVGVENDVVYMSYEQAYGRDFEETRRRAPDVARARRLLNFEASVSLDVGLRKTIKWFEEHLDDFISA